MAAESDFISEMSRNLSCLEFEGACERFNLEEPR